MIQLSEAIEIHREFAKSAGDCARDRERMLAENFRTVASENRVLRAVLRCATEMLAAGRGDEALAAMRVWAGK